jgi:tRNA A58 N-methylase Trm61
MPSDHLLTSGDAEMQRLRLQAQVWEPAAIDFLATLDIRPGWKALDLGCGAMGILRPLSRSVGDTGMVVGLDSDASLRAKSSQPNSAEDGRAMARLAALVSVLSFRLAC